MTSYPRWLLGLYLATLIVTCWLGMMLVHECGHMLAAMLSGGTVTRVVFHLLAFSRTDIDPNPHPLVVAWCGPLLGAFLPALGARGVGPIFRRI